MILRILLLFTIVPLAHASEICSREVTPVSKDLEFPIQLAPGARAAFWTIFNPLPEHLVYTVDVEGGGRELRFFHWIDGRIDSGSLLRDPRGSIFAVLDYEGRQAVATHTLVRNAPDLPALPGEGTGPRETHRVRLFDYRSGEELHNFTIRIHSPSTLNGLVYSGGHFLVLDSHQVLWHVDPTGRFRVYEHLVKAVKVGLRGEFWIHRSPWNSQEGNFDNLLERHDDLENFVVTTELGLNAYKNTSTTNLINTPDDFWICGNDRALIARWDGGVEAIRLSTGERLQHWPQPATKVFVLDGYIYSADLKGSMKRWRVPEGMCE